MARTKRISYTAPYTSPSFNNARALEFGGNFILSGMEVTDLGGYQIRVDIGALVNNGIIVELDASEDFSVPGITGADKYFYCYSPTSIEDQDLEFGLVDSAGWNSLYTLIAHYDSNTGTWHSGPRASINDLTKDPFVSVGDGINSVGSFNGNDAIQEAVDSLAITKGKVYVKPGTYHLNQPITMFSNIEIEGSKGALIIGPVDDYAFQVEGVSGIKLEQIEVEPNPAGASPKNTINFSNVDSSWVVNCRATRRDNVYALELENDSNRSIFIGNDFETPLAAGATDVMINAGCDDNIYVGNQDRLTNGGNNVIINKFISIPGDIGLGGDLAAVGDVDLGGNLTAVGNVGCEDVNPLGDISLVAGKTIDGVDPSAEVDFDNPFSRISLEHKPTGEHSDVTADTFVCPAVSAENISNTKEGPARTATHNQSDVPAPTTYGGGTVWVELRTDGTNEIVLDDSIDWRDRFITVQGYGKESATSELPGTAGDNNLDGYLDTDAATIDGVVSRFVSGFLFTENGSAGVGVPRMIIYTEDHTQIAYLYAKSSNGNLAFKYDDAGAPSNESDIILKIDYSPKQNHY